MPSIYILSIFLIRLRTITEVGNLQVEIPSVNTFRWYFYPLITVITIYDVFGFANKAKKFDIHVIARQLADEVPKESLQGFFR